MYNFGCEEFLLCNSRSLAPEKRYGVRRFDFKGFLNSLAHTRFCGYILSYSGFDGISLWVP